MWKISNDNSIHFPPIFEGFERFHKVLVGLKKRRRKDEEQRESRKIKNCNLPKAAWIEYPAKLLVIGGLLLQPILGLSSPWRRALLGLLPEGPEPGAELSRAHLPTTCRVPRVRKCDIRRRYGGEGFGLK